MSISPGAGAALSPSTVLPKVYKWYKLTRGVYKALKGSQSVAEITGSMIGGKVVGKVTGPISARITKMHLRVANAVRRDRSRKNGLGGRSWITEPGVYEMVIVFHDANRAGPHIDVHIGNLSLIYRVKPETYSQLRYNREGYLTENSRKILLDHVRSEIATHSRVPQNLDHSPTNARASWVNGDTTGTNYGDGATRQVISLSHVDVYKAFADGPIEFYSPVLNSTKSLYLYRIYPGEGNRAPICIFGEKNRMPPPLEDRLHLKMVDPSRLEHLSGKVDMSTSTAKYDGSSAYIVIGPKGTLVWGPRVSRVHGRQIEYTHKLRGIHMTTNGETIVAMGEVLFTDKNGRKVKGNHYLPSATGSGILNSHDVLPQGVKPEIRLYRVDKVGRRSTVDLPFWENRELQEQVAALNPDMLKVVELMSPDEALRQGYEGVVVVPHDASVNDGNKVKWWGDSNDWRIDRVSFKLSEKGAVAGVVETTSLDSGKKFNLGPGQVGSRALTEHMMNHPDDFEGVVLKVDSRNGHEGRAAKVVGFHDDKGLHIQVPQEITA